MALLPAPVPAGCSSRLPGGAGAEAEAERLRRQRREAELAQPFASRGASGGSVAGSSQSLLPTPADAALQTAPAATSAPHGSLRPEDLSLKQSTQQIMMSRQPSVRDCWTRQMPCPAAWAWKCSMPAATLWAAAASSSSCPCCRACASHRLMATDSLAFLPSLSVQRHSVCQPCRLVLRTRLRHQDRAARAILVRQKPWQRAATTRPRSF